MYNKKYFEYSRYETSSEMITNNIHDIMKLNDKFCIVILNTEFKVDLSKLNLDNFNKFTSGEFYSRFDNTEKNNQEVINLFVKNDYVADDYLSIFVGREVTHVIVIKDKPTERQKRLFYYVETRIRG